MYSISSSNSTSRLNIWIILLGIGLFLLLCNLVYAARYLVLDFYGEQAPAKLIVSHHGCRSSKGGHATCYDADLVFTDVKGTEHHVGAGLFPILWDAVFSSDPSNKHSYDVNVKYFPSFPYFAKTIMPYHMEYVGACSIWPFLFMAQGGFALLGRRRNRKASDNNQPEDSQPGVFS